jgi:orotate phosphoribosyltransferase
MIPEYKRACIQFLAETGSFFLGTNLRLKDGRPTPYFINLGMFNSGKTMGNLARLFAQMIMEQKLIDQFDVLIGPSFKGSALACAISLVLDQIYNVEKRFDYDRVIPKTHGESSGGKSLFVNQALHDGDRILIVDDVATSMHTKLDLLHKIHQQGQQTGATYAIEGIAIVVDRQQTQVVIEQDEIQLEKKGADAVAEFSQSTGIPVRFLLTISELLSTVYQEGIPVCHHIQKDGRITQEWKTLSADTYEECKQYLNTYGTSTITL